MNPADIIANYYDVGSDAYRILMAHSRDVTDKALAIARAHPEMNLDTDFIREAAMLHDIGMFMCNAPEIDCHGNAHYICHGYLGADLMRKEGYPRHALVCERHTGTGLSEKEIIARRLPLPHRDMLPVSMEEQLICFADKFYSKTNLGKEKPADKIKKSLLRHGEATLLRFEHWCKLFYTALILLAGSMALQAQEITEPAAESIVALPDTLPPAAPDTAASKNALEAPVTYTASDSIIMTAGNWAYLYGQGNVKYQQIELEAETIEMNMDSSLIFAKFGLDSIGEEFGYPLFKDGGQEYESKTMRYNFKSKKGYITDVLTQQGEGYVTATRTKKMDDDILNMADGRYTTCDEHDHPHFYIQMTRAKVRPKKDIVTGPVYLVLADVPLYPLGLPFAFFPFSEKYSSGVLFPSYSDESVRGFALRDGGYYFALNDYADLALTGEIYTKGSWGLTARSNYRKRYSYSGSFNANYLVTKLGDKGLSDYSLTKDFKLAMTHSQDPKANPFRTISASVNFATSSYDRNNIQGMYGAGSTQNTKGSSVSITQRFPNSPFSISGTANLNQVQRDTTLSVTLPDITVTMSRIFPFKRKNMVGSERWYEKISMSYSGYLRNSISTKEYKFFQSNIIRDWKNAMQHQIPVGATFSVFNYINISPNVSYTERWYTNKIAKEYDIQKDQLITSDTTYGFHRVYNYNASVSASTTLYGIFQPMGFLRKWVKTIRHRMDPSVSIGFAPDFSNRRYGFYEEYRYLNARGEEQTVFYSPYENGMFSVPGRGRQGNISLSLDNNIEAKVASDKDSTGIKKLSLIDKLSFAMSHNLVADSFKWSDLNVNLRLKLTKSYSINLNGQFDTYTYETSQNANGVWSHRRVDKLRIQSGKGLGRLKSTGTSFSYTFNNETFKTGLLGRLFGTAGTSEEESSSANDPEGTDTLDQIDQYGENQSLVPEESTGGGRLRGKKKDTSGEYDADGYWTNTFPWSLSFNYSLNLGYGDFNYIKKEYNYKLTHALSFSGNVQPTKNWRFNFNATYDFDTKKISYLTCNLTRNLHCFNMTASFIPVGPYKSYSFSVAVSSSLLKDLKYDRRSNYREGQQWY
jgi:putative nucleotidyltransferase with HDIG domain